MLNIKKCFYVLFALLFMNSALAESEKAAVEQTYKDWCNAISEANGNYKKMVKFYAPDAVLLATFSPKILVNKNGGLNEYFKTFTKNPDIDCIPGQLKTQVFGDIAVNSGLYTFSYTEKDGKTKVVPARFTFVYELKDKQWLIIEHHSSLNPASM